MSELDLEVLREVFEIIVDRRDRPKTDSYVCGLMSQGLEGILEKIGEETKELAKAARREHKDTIVHEAADLIFHIMMLLAYQNTQLSEVLDELRRRRKKESG